MRELGHACCGRLSIKVTVAAFKSESTLSRSFAGDHNKNEHRERLPPPPTPPPPAALSGKVVACARARARYDKISQERLSPPRGGNATTIAHDGRTDGRTGAEDGRAGDGPLTLGFFNCNYARLVLANGLFRIGRRAAGWLARRAIPITNQRTETVKGVSRKGQAGR